MLEKLKIEFVMLVHNEKHSDVRFMGNETCHFALDSYRDHAESKIHKNIYMDSCFRRNDIDNSFT